MKIEFEDGSFVLLNDIGSEIELVQCAKLDRKLMMSSSKLDRGQVQRLIDFLAKWNEREEVNGKAR